MAVAETVKDLHAHLNEMGPVELLAWAAANHPGRAGIITSFQDTGCVLIDMMARAAVGLRVITVDTLRLHPETYALMAELESRFGITVERITPDPERLKRMIAQHGEYLFFDSKAKQEFCCNVRKTEPNQRALETLDVWFTGLRRDQSEFRENTPKISLVDRKGRKILKIAPLVDWEQREVNAYIQEHAVPYNKLYDQGYTSIGCVICSTPTLPGEDKRAGRWRWFNALEKNNKECGIHMGGSGI